MATLAEIARFNLNKAAEEVKARRAFLDACVTDLLAYDTQDERWEGLQGQISIASLQLQDACEAYAEAYSDAVEADAVV